MTNWQPVPPPLPPQPSTADSIGCVECGRLFSPDQVLVIGNAPVCAGCKPAYLQRLRESGKGFRVLEYGGFWIRFTAWMIDITILSVVWFILAAPVRLLTGFRNPADSMTALALSLGALGLQALLNFALMFAYNVYFVSVYGATPGKQLLQLTIVLSDGSRLSAGQAVGRFFAWLVSYIPFMAGLIMAGFDAEKRALHDRICDTRVIYTGAPPVPGKTAAQVISCGNCGAPVSPEDWNREEGSRCRQCARKIEVAIFPALLRSRTGALPEALAADTEASCFFHPQSRAAIPCDECGRFLCRLCDLEIDGRHLCPACFQNGVQSRKLEVVETRRTMYDTVALAFATFPALLFWPVIFSAPAALFVVLRRWRAPGSLLPRTKIRFYLAALFAVAELAGFVALIWTLVTLPGRRSL
jgi:uncharacterized RDD family membrane protein YckC